MNFGLNSLFIFFELTNCLSLIASVLFIGLLGSTTVGWLGSTTVGWLVFTTVGCLGFTTFGWEVFCNGCVAESGDCVFDLVSLEIFD